MLRLYIAKYPSSHHNTHIVPESRSTTILAIHHLYQRILIFAKKPHSVSDPTEECEVFHEYIFAYAHNHTVLRYTPLP